MNKTNILLLVEGSNTDAKVMEKLINVFELDVMYNIIPYQTNIYELYDRMFLEEEEELLDVVQVLKEIGRINDSYNDVLDLEFTDILLVFDLDPHDKRYKSEKIDRLLSYFNESTDNGMLYINYPMVESFYHQNSNQDDLYINKKMNLNDISKYKRIVNEECYQPNYRKYCNNKTELRNVINKNIIKINYLTGKEDINHCEIFNVQKNMLLNNELYVICTCILFIYDYNSALLK